MNKDEKITTLKEIVASLKREIDELEAENKAFRKREYLAAELQAQLDDVRIWIHESAGYLNNLKDYVARKE